MILCDTDVLIEFYKGNPATVQELQVIGQANIAVSVITKAELLYGAKDKKEFALIDSNLSQCACYQVTAEISGLFVQLMRDYALSHRPKIPDMLIAATAISQGLDLYTLNTRDFRFIGGLQLYLEKSGG